MLVFVFVSVFAGVASRRDADLILFFDTLVIFCSVWIVFFVIVGLLF